MGKRLPTTPRSKVTLPDHLEALANVGYGLGAFPTANAPRIVPPSNDTLKKYGMTSEDWLSMLHEQGYVCPICKKNIETSEVSTTKGTKTTITYKTNAHIDHIHVPKWKKMKPEERRKYVRGILCQFCNRFYMCKQMTREKAMNIVAYLKQ